MADEEGAHYAEIDSRRPRGESCLGCGQPVVGGPFVARWTLTREGSTDFVGFEHVGHAAEETS